MCVPNSGFGQVGCHAPALISARLLDISVNDSDEDKAKDEQDAKNDQGDDQGLAPLSFGGHWRER